MLEIMHIGLPTQTPQPGEVYSPDMKLHIAGPETNEMRIEYLRFEADSPMPQELKDNVHVAYKVDSLEKYMQGNKIILPRTKLDDCLSIAFIEKNGLVIELMEMK